MIGMTVPPYLGLWRWVFETVTGALRDRQKVLDAHYQLGIEVFAALAGARGENAEAAAPGPGVEPGPLEEVAAERMRRGLAPPREIHDVHNRGRLDWSQFPDRARPADPELFEGSHEG
jgi:hypothetical protein